jgi:hypothetical protein
LELAAAHAGSTLFADEGFWGKEYRDYMELIDIRLITPERHRRGPRPPGEVAKARIRLVIESVFANLERQMRLEQHLAKILDQADWWIGESPAATNTARAWRWEECECWTSGGTAW